eukprot:8461211-Pyramimonas_sp.AAC.1
MTSNLFSGLTCGARASVSAWALGGEAARSGAGASSGGSCCGDGLLKTLLFLVFRGCGFSSSSSSSGDAGGA